MILTSLGRIAVPAPGTPVALSTNARIQAARLVIQTAPLNTGKTYFGLKGMDKITLAGVSRVLDATDNYEVTTEDGMDGIPIFQLAVDADNPGEGLLVSYWTE